MSGQRSGGAAEEEEDHAAAAAAGGDYEDEIHTNNHHHHINHHINNYNHTNRHHNAVVRMDEGEEEEEDTLRMAGGCSLREGESMEQQQQPQLGVAPASSASSSSSPYESGTQLLRNYSSSRHSNSNSNSNSNTSSGGGGGGGGSSSSSTGINLPPPQQQRRQYHHHHPLSHCAAAAAASTTTTNHDDGTLEENVGLAVFTWGRGEDGQLGLGDTADQDEPTYVDALRGVGVRHIACGSGHTVVLTTDGEIFTWGRGDDGRLGHGGTGWKYVPRLCQSLTGYVVTAVTCGSYHTAAVTSAGDLWTWGGGMYGKLGHGNEAGSSTPKRVEALVGHCVTLIACGSRHTAVVLSTGALYSWGDQDNGVAGHGDLLSNNNNNINNHADLHLQQQHHHHNQQHHGAVNNQDRGHHQHHSHQYLPRLVERLAGRHVVQLSACGFHTGCLTDVGECYTWGEGKFGRLGHNSEANCLTPRLVEALLDKNPRQISCGGFHTAVVTEEGHLYTFGGGEHGQLGHNDRVNKLKPTLVQALEHVFCSQITCGWSHSVALDAKGRVYTWGNSDHGKLGHGSSRKVAVPQLVKQLRDYRVVRVASYNEHTAALVEPYMQESGKTPQMGMFGAGSRSHFTAVNAVPVTAAYTQQIRALVNDDEFSDVTFMIEKEPIYAHRAILAQRCEHFAAMFRSGMRESSERVIVIPNISKKVFLLLLEYIYIDAVKIDVEHAIELYSAADLYHMERLRDMCCTVVRRNLSAENSGPLLQTAAVTHCHVLKDICMMYVVENFDTVSKTEGIKQVSHGLLLEILGQR